MLNAIHEINVEHAIQYIKNLQNDDGSFSGDEWGEIDTRFSFCAVNALSLLVSIHDNSFYSFIVIESTCFRVILML